MALPSMLCVIPILNGRKLHIHRYTLLPQWKGSNNGGVIFMFWISAFHFLKEIIYVLTQSKLTWLHTYIKYLHMYHMFILREQIKNSDLMVGFFLTKKDYLIWFDIPSFWTQKVLFMKWKLFLDTFWHATHISMMKNCLRNVMDALKITCSLVLKIKIGFFSHFYFLIEIHKIMHLL